jgi:hypothetical protein
MADFITKRENARRLAIIILCAIGIAVSLAVGIYAIKEKDFHEKGEKNPFSIAKLKPEIDQKRETLKVAQDMLLAYSRTNIGWADPSRGSVDRFPTTAMNVESMKKFLDDWNGELKKIGVTKYKNWSEKATDDALHLTQLFEELIAKEKEYQTRVTDLTAQIQKERTDEAATNKSTYDGFQAILKEITGGVAPGQDSTGHIGELKRLIKEFNALQKSHAEELANLEVETNAKMDESTKVKNENLRKRAASDAVKTDFKRRIFAIQHHREEAKERREPDGEVLSIDEKREIAYINLLRKDRLFKGTKFQAYSLEKGGQKLDKATLEVIEVREDTASVCAIRRTVDPDWPLKVGDKIYNDLYEGGRIRHISIAGRFTGRLSNEEAAHLVRKQGDIFQEKVDEKTNYVVVADGYEEHPNYKAALEYGIKILREPILYDYLGVPRR